MPKNSTFQNFNAETLVTRAFSQPGPMTGNGRGPGRPWGGIVEETPGIWITWIASAAKAAGIEPMTLQISFGGIVLQMTRVKLTFGWRYYWSCPLCARRCEAIYHAGRVGCQRCLNLGYSSEAHRPNSARFVLDCLLSRRWPFEQRRRWNIPDNASTAILAGLQGEFEKRLQALFDNLKIREDHEQSE